MSELRTMVERLGFTHFWIAIAASLSAAGSVFAFSNGLELDSPDWSLLLTIGASTGWVYTFQRWMKSTRKPEQMPPYRLEFMRKHGGRLGVLWTILALWASTHWLLGLERSESATGSIHGILILCAAVLSIGYAFNPMGSGRGWRERPHLKLPAIALSWTLATVIFPASHIGLNLWGMESLPLWGLACSQAFFVAGITVPFDVRDLNIDPLEFQTWPQRWGPFKSIRIALFLLALSAAGFLFCDINWGRATISLLALPIVAWTVRPRKEAVYSLLLDGLLILQGSAVFWFGVSN